MAFTTSGTAAFERILQRESLQGSRVLFPAFICQGAFGPLIDQYDLEPVFVDVDARTRHLDFEEVTRHLPSVDVVVLVHAFGLPVPTERWAGCVAQRDDVLLVEDCARALGARSGGQPVGASGDYGIYSFSKATPLFTGGCLVSGVPGDSFDLGPPAFGPDLFVKTAYDACPWELPFRAQISTYYHELLGDRNYSTAQYGLSENTVKRLDSVNQWRVNRYLGRQFDHSLMRQRSIAESIRPILEDYGFGVQPDAAGRVYHALPATVPGDRDALVEFLRSRGHAVRIVWSAPLGLEYAPVSDYPVTATLSEQSVLFRVVDMTGDDISRLERDLGRFYRRGRT